ncbi:MAG: YerC/YecD family TrpR-related protein [Acutalibacteraceae bacterium]|nr:YerC/YecD family TrpR-related protein [Acutalibacteraceae bacterium]
MAKIGEDMINELYKVIVSIDSVEDCKLLFEDLCTHKEVENMAQRICAARLLKKGETYNQVMQKTGIASATLARVSSCVKYGKGYDKFIK